MNNYLKNLDHQWLYHIQQQRLTLLDSPFSIISEMATYVVIALILWIGIKAWIQRSKPLLHQFYFLTITELTSAIGIYVFKHIVNRDRPYVSFSDIQKIGSGGGMSFPSGHTTEAFCMAWAFVLAFPMQKNYRFLFIWATLVAYSRMILGVHYPFDVLAGIAYGTFLSWMMYLLLKNKLLK